jgi:hypothetical protein
MTALDTIVEKARALRVSRDAIDTIVRSLQRGIDELKADKLPELREAIEAATTAWRELEAQIQAHPELFVRPRTQEAHGIKFGVMQGKGSLQIPDQERTLQLIDKHLADSAEQLIITRREPAKSVLATLSANDLKRIGVTVVPGTDTVFIKPADREVDGLVKALLANSIEEQKA